MGIVSRRILGIYRIRGNKSLGGGLGHQQKHPDIRRSIWASPARTLRPHDCFKRPTSLKSREHRLGSFSTLLVIGDLDHDDRCLEEKPPSKGSSLVFDDRGARMCANGEINPHALSLSLPWTCQRSISHCSVRGEDISPFSEHLRMPLKL